MTDPLAAELEQVRKRMAAAPRTTVAALASAADVPRLVAAVEAALDLHKPDGFSLKIRPCKAHSIGRTELPPSRLAAAQEACPDCQVSRTVRCWQRGCPSEWPCPTYAAISAALTGEGASDGE